MPLQQEQRSEECEVRVQGLKGGEKLIKLPQEQIW